MLPFIIATAALFALISLCLVCISIGKREATDDHADIIHVHEATIKDLTAECGQLVLNVIKLTKHVEVLRELLPKDTMCTRCHSKPLVWHSASGDKGLCDRCFDLEYKLDRLNHKED